MPQEMNVLCCYSCKMFQVNIGKNSRKWQCKICNEKQSLQTIYFHGTGSECRDYVMSVNAARRTSQEETFRVASIVGWGLDCDADNDAMCDCNKIAKLNEGRWSKFVTRENEETLPHENFSSQGDLGDRRKRDASGKQTRSLPAMGNSQAGVTSPGSRTFPRTEENSRRPGKWEKFLNPKNNFLETKEEEVSLADPESTLNEESEYLTSDDDLLDSLENVPATKSPIGVCSSSDTFLNRKSEDGPSWQSKWEDITGEWKENSLVGADLKASQVDASSESSGASDGKPTIFDDFRDLDVTIDF